MTPVVWGKSVNEFIKIFNGGRSQKALKNAREFWEINGGYLLDGAAGYCVTNDEWYAYYCVKHGGAVVLEPKEDKHEQVL